MMQRRKATLNGQAQGFTLVELILVLVIIAVAASLVGPALSKRFTEADPRRVIVQLRSVMELLRVQAVQRGREEILVIAPETKRYWLEGRGETVEIPHGSGDLSAQGRFVRDEGEVEIHFYPDGTNSGGEVQIEQQRSEGETIYRLSLNPLLGTATVWRAD